MKILKIGKSKLVIAGIILLFFLCMPIIVSASESKSADPSKVELPLPVPEQDTEYEELDPTQILNMQELLPDSSQITALGQVPKGAGSVIESETSGAVKTPEGKEFYIIQTKDEETFFLVIDHAKASDNVYFLSQINGENLTGTETNQVKPETDNSFLDKDKEQEQVPPKAEDKDVTPEEEEESTKDIPVESTNVERGGGAFFFILLCAVVFGIGYYTKIYKPKQKVLDDALDFESDFEGVHDENFEEWEEENEFEDEKDDAEEEEEEDDPEEEWEEPVVEKKKRKPIVQENEPTTKEKSVPKEQPKTSKIGMVVNVIGKFVFGFILLGLVSLGLTVLTNESLRNMIMETVKNYF